jgi:hypothetical protein
VTTVTCPKTERYPKWDTLKFSARRFCIIQDIDLKLYTIKGYALMYSHVQKNCNFRCGGAWQLVDINSAYMVLVWLTAITFQVITFL